MARSQIPATAWMVVPAIPASLKTAYANYKDASAEAAKLRTTFEAAFLAKAKADGSVAKGQTMVFSHNFGRLSVAIVAETAAHKSTTQRVFKLK